MPCVRNPDYLAAVNNNACEAERAGAYGFSRRCCWMKLCIKSRFIAAIRWGKGEKKGISKTTPKHLTKVITDVFMLSVCERLRPVLRLYSQ